MNMATHIGKDIPLTLAVEEPVSTCPYRSWYRFKTCNIKTCKNYTSRTATKCLALDRESPTGNKIISDAELHLFKFSEMGVSTRLVSHKRKKAVTRVKQLLALSHFLEHVQRTYGSTSAEARVFKDPELQDMESQYPLKVKRLHFENWMWPFLISRREYKVFASRGTGEASEFTVMDLLDIPQSKLEGLRKIVD
jgi:hypothetical protein